jgi:peptide/nickel transport system substrate-binding protein
MNNLLKRTRKSLLPLIGLIIATLVIGVGCGSADNEWMETPGSKSGGHLKVGMLADFNTFDPPLLVGMPDIYTVIHTHDVLVFRNPDLTLQPALATSWVANEDSTEWTLELRKGVKFSNGKEFNADDVIFTINRLYEVESPLASVMIKPARMVADDPHTLRLIFEKPNAVLLDSLVKYQFSITPSNVDTSTFATTPVGTGPFILKEHITGERTYFVKNPDYWWDGHPLVEELTFIFLPDPESRAEALKAGIVDIIADLDVSSVPGLRGHPDTDAVVAPAGGYLNVAFDVTVPPYDNVLVRKAVQLVTDRQAILQAVQFGMGGIAYDHPIAESHPVFNPDCVPPAYDPQKAKELLAQAGYPDGIDLTLTTSTAGGGMVELATVFKEKAAPAGINIDINVVPEDGYWSDAWLVEPFLTVWWGGRPPYEAFSVVYKGGGSWNEAKYANARVDELLDLAMQKSGIEDQKAIYGEIQCIIVDEVPRIIPVFRPVLLGLRNDVRGMVPMWDATMSLHRAWLDR